MMLFAIDPGTTESAVIAWDGQIRMAKIMPNEELLAMVRRSKAALAGARMAVETIASYGMAVGRETFETCEFCGRLREAAEANGATVQRVYRKDVKINLCGTMKAKDTNIRAALLDKYGKDVLKGIKSHLWSAMAVADYALTHP